MSLQVWLPLNGNLNNQGLANVSHTAGTPQYKTPGKISNNALDLKTRIYFSCEKLANLQTFSVAFWALVGSSSSLTTNWQDLIGFVDVSSGGTSGTFRWETTYASQNGIHWHDNTTNAFVNNSHQHITVKDVWVHCCVVFNNELGKIYSYDNGVLKQTDTHLGGKFNSTGTFYLGETNNIEGMIQDVRFYNHALSAKEVEEIAKGLVLHYKLDNVKTSIWSLNYYKKTATLTTSNTYIYSLPSKTIYLVPGKQYTIGAQIKVNQDNIKFNFDTNCTDENGVYTGNDAAQTVQYNPTITLEKDTWTQVWATTTIKSDAGKPYYHHGFLFKTTSGELTTLCEIQNIEIYEGSAQVFTTYDKTNAVYDSSGYNNNGTIVGSLETIIPSPRYSCAIHHLDSCADYIYTDALTFLGNSGFTFACWAQCNNYTRTSGGTASTGNQFIVSQGRDYRETSDKSYGASIVMYNGTPIWYCGNGTVSSNTQISLNTWCHIAGTYDGSVKKIYINGELKNNIADTQVNWENNTGNKLVIGKMSYSYTSTTAYFPFVGNISDVRIYATALTAEQIKELYNTSMTIDNQGNIHARELVE